MRKVALVVIALGGCTTMAGTQDRTPIASFPTAKAVPALEECLSTRLSWLGLPSTVRGPDRTILAYGNPNPAFTLTLGEGSVDVRATMVRPGGRFTRAVQSCL